MLDSEIGKPDEREIAQPLHAEVPRPPGGVELAAERVQALELKDPVGDLYYPLYRGRDGCRTPVPWDSGAPNLGFTTGSPWLQRLAIPRIPLALPAFYTTA